MFATETSWGVGRESTRWAEVSQPSAQARDTLSTSPNTLLFLGPTRSRINDYSFICWIEKEVATSRAEREGIWECGHSFLLLLFKRPSWSSRAESCLLKRTHLFLVNSRCSGRVSSVCQVVWIQKRRRSCLLLSGELNKGLAGGLADFPKGIGILFGGVLALHTPELQGSNGLLLVKGITRLQKRASKMAQWGIVATKSDTRVQCSGPTW